MFSVLIPIRLVNSGHIFKITHGTFVIHVMCCVMWLLIGKWFNWWILLIFTIIQWLYTLSTTHFKLDTRRNTMSLQYIPIYPIGVTHECIEVSVQPSQCTVKNKPDVSNEIAIEINTRPVTKVVLVVSYWSAWAIQQWWCVELPQFCQTAMEVLKLEVG